MVGFSWPCGCCCKSEAYVICGIWNTSPSGSGGIEGFSFSTETWCGSIASASPNVIPSVYILGAASNGDDAIYYGGGLQVFTVMDDIYKLTTLGTETSSLVSSAELGRPGIGNVLSDISTKSYWTTRDATQVDGHWVHTIYKLVNSTETSSATSTANTHDKRASYVTLTEGTTKGYFIAGSSYSGATLNNKETEIDECTYSTDTTSLSSAAVIEDRRLFMSLGAGTSVGYFSGGYDDVKAVTYSRIKTTEKLTYATDTVSAVGTADLTDERSQGCGFSDGSTKGFWATGFEGSSNDAALSRASCDKFDFSTETISVATDSPRDKSSPANGASANGY